MKLLLFVLLLLVPLRAQAFCDDWRTSDTVLESAFLAEAIIDWTATLNFRSHGVSELNPILGKYPTRGQVNIYFLTVLPLHALAACYARGDLRTLLLSLSVVVEAEPVIHNTRAGWIFRF